MAYEPRPGSLSLFKNDRKEKDSHPDYRGDGLLLDGTPVWVSAWVKEGAKGKFFSLSLQPKEKREDDFRGSTRGGGSSGLSGDDHHSRHEDPFADEVPFATPYSIW